MPNIQFQFRRGTASQWTSANPTLASGELGLETDTYQFKIGNGATGWVGLPYVGITGPTGASGGGSGTPGGVDTTVQFNKASSFSGSTGFVYDYTRQRVGIGTQSPTGVLDVCGSGVNPVFLRAPVYSRIAMQDIAAASSVTVSDASSGIHYNITNSAFSGITLPASTTTTQGGVFWVFRNNTPGSLAITVTNNANIPSSQSIPVGNSLTIAISSNANNTFVLF
jgi:hypothetical protein